MRYKFEIVLSILILLFIFKTRLREIVIDQIKLKINIKSRLTSRNLDSDKARNKFKVIEM